MFIKLEEYCSSTIDLENTSLKAVNFIVGVCLLLECAIRFGCGASVISFFLFPVFVFLGLCIFSVSDFVTELAVRYSCSFYLKFQVMVWVTMLLVYGIVMFSEMQYGSYVAMNFHKFWPWLIEIACTIFKSQVFWWLVIVAYILLGILTLIALARTCNSSNRERGEWICPLISTLIKTPRAFNPSYHFQSVVSLREVCSYLSLKK